MSEASQFWTRRTLPEDKVGLWRFGLLRLWIERRGTEWQVSVERGDTALRNYSVVPGDVKPDLDECTVYALSQGYPDFECEPMVPDRPVVLKPHIPLVLPPGQSATYYARVPCFVRLFAVNGAGRVLLKSLPTKVLSDTWFGDTMEGVFCYALAVSAERDPSALDAQPHHLIVPVSIHNDSDSDLPFEKLCLRLEYVDIFAGHDCLWTSTIRVHHKTRAMNSEVDYSGGDPSVAGQLRLLRPAESKPKDLVRRSFGWIAQKAHQLY